jgi:hypothetical protein
VRAGGGTNTSVPASAPRHSISKSWSKATAHDPRISSVPRKLSPEQLDSIALQVFVQDAAEVAAGAAGLHLRPGPLEWDGGTMDVRSGDHVVILATTDCAVALTIAHGRADDAAWQSGARAEIARGIGRLVAPLPA